MIILIQFFMLNSNFVVSGLENVERKNERGFSVEGACFGLFSRKNNFFATKKTFRGKVELYFCAPWYGGSNGARIRRPARKAKK